MTAILNFSGIIGKIENVVLLMVVVICMGCNDGKTGDSSQSLEGVRLIVLDPGHFHAALLQKSMDAGVDSIVQVYAPEGQGLSSYLGLISQYNSRKIDPTSWVEKVYTGSDYLERMLRDRSGNLVVLAGNNQKKTEYIQKSIDAGLNVLADKPMAITDEGFIRLKDAFAEAKKKNLLLYDIMTERYEVTNILQRAFRQMADVFGQLQKGTTRDPAAIFESVHHFYKEVSGKPIVRPDWYFDINQQGEGIVDVTTHLTDLIQWECFPEAVFDYGRDVKIVSARHWPTILSPTEFRMVTGQSDYPTFLQDALTDSLLNVYANGEFNYTLRGVHARVSAIWKFQAPEGMQDTYHALLRGSKADLIIRQGETEHFKPVLYIRPVVDNTEWENALIKGLHEIGKSYPGVTLEKSGLEWKVSIPEKFKVGHEQHFALVIGKYLQFLTRGEMPDWEVSFMLTKYYTTTEALKIADEER